LSSVDLATGEELVPQDRIELSTYPLPRHLFKRFSFVSADP